MPLSTDPLEVERASMQEVFRENSNRKLGSLEALFAGDIEVAVQHFLDAYFVSTHQAAEMEAKRWAAFKGNDALVRRRAAVQQSTVDIMFAISKKESTQNNFFLAGGSSGRQQQAVQSQTQSVPSVSNPATFRWDPTTNTFIPATVQQVGGAVQVQSRSRFGRRRGRLPCAQDNTFQNFKGSQGGQRGFFGYRRGTGRGYGWPVGAPGSGILPSPAPPVQPLPPQ
jgi:hypothetical protein